MTNDTHVEHELRNVTVIGGGVIGISWTLVGVPPLCQFCAGRVGPEGTNADDCGRSRGTLA